MRPATRAALLLSALILLAAFMAGCGGSGDNPPSDSTGCDNSGVAGARVCTDTKGTTQ